MLMKGHVVLFGKDWNNISLNLFMYGYLGTCLHGELAMFPSRTVVLLGTLIRVAAVSAFRHACFRLVRHKARLLETVWYS